MEVGGSASPLVRDWRDWGVGEDLPAPDCQTAKRDNDKKKRIAEWFGWGQVISGVNMHGAVGQGEVGEPIAACRCLGKVIPRPRFAQSKKA